MKRRKNKVLKIILSIVIIGTVGGFVLNGYLTYRLQTYLRAKLSQIVSESTDGFYKLDFKRLKIGLFSGELEIDSIDFRPDRSVFNEWKAKDSLPQTYLDIKIEKIHFRGINLTWRVSYKKLNFDLFEIAHPIIHVYEFKDSDRLKIPVKDGHIVVLHDFIAPYINVLTVDKMNLENASIKYQAEESGKIATYDLDNISFHAYGFKLDENSFFSGKLLYCDNFDFTTNQSQTLLSNNQIKLAVDKIRLDTKDSIIEINKISLQPQKILWRQKGFLPDNYVEAEVNSVEVKGIKFTRYDALNNLKARLFSIDRTKFDYYDIKRSGKTAKIEEQKSDSMNLSWTLYAMVSPVLHSIKINQVEIKDAGMSYSSIKDNLIDFYKLDRFRFHAYDFKVDSLADIQKKFLYSEGFDVHAEGISGTIASKNHVFSLGHMYLDTRDSLFRVSEVKLWPLTTQTENDYMRGTIDSIAVTGMYYNKGLINRSFDIYNPHLEYVSKPPTRVESIKQDTIQYNKSHVNKLDLITPFFGFLSIQEFQLNNGNILFDDQSSGAGQTYRMPKVNFSATEVFLDKETIQQTNTYFRYKDFNIRFEDFDNYLPGKEYRLTISKGLFDGHAGNLQLSDIKLIPQEKTGKKSPDTYIRLSIPYLALNGFLNRENTARKQFDFNWMSIKSPHIEIVKTHNDASVKSKSKKSDFSVGLKFLALTNARLTYYDQVTDDSLSLKLNNYQMNSFTWNSGETFSVDKIIVDDPAIRFVQKERQQKNSSENKSVFPLSGVKINSVKVNNTHFDIQNSQLRVSGAADNFSLDQLSWDKLQLGIASISISKPVTKIHQYIEPHPNQPIPPKEGYSLYTELSKMAKDLDIGHIAVKDAVIDYSNTIQGKLATKQKINSTNFDLTGLTLNQEARTVNIQDFNLNTQNFRFPIDNGFYTMEIGEINAHKKNAELNFSNLHLIPAYPKEKFAYVHPKHQDWFDVSVGEVILKNIDYPTYFSSKVLNIGNGRVSDIKLLNFKNQNIDIQHNIMPMIYEGLQKAPLKLNIDTLKVHNFMVQYEELSKGATIPGKIFFTDMNGTFSGFTNVVSREQQYIKLKANGKLMGTGAFDALWYIPVDYRNDRFLLTAQLENFDLRDLNQLVTPLAPVEIKSGYVNSLEFKTEASSLSAKIHMRLLYNDLKVALYKSKDGVLAPDKLMNNLVGVVLKKDNPDKRKKKPREPLLSIKRDPYHSTFNYLWQILQPPVVESIGISQKKQNLAKQAVDIFSKVKDFFKKKLNPKEKENMRFRPVKK